MTLSSSGCDIERVDVVGVGVLPGDVVGEGVDVHGAGGEVDDRGAGDADVGRGVVVRAVTRADVGARDGGGGSEIDVPQQALARAGIAVGVEGVDIVGHRDDEDDVHGAFAGDGEIRDVKRLGVDLPADGVGKELSEGAGVDVGGGEDLFVRIEAVGARSLCQVTTLAERKSRCSSASMTARCRDRLTILFVARVATNPHFRSQRCQDADETATIFDRR